MTPSYAPNEPHSTIVAEETWFQGSLLSSLFFGVHLTLSAMSFLAVLRQHTGVGRRMRIAILSYILILLVIMTASQGLSDEFMQMAFVTNRNYPGGPSAFLNQMYSTPSNLGSTVLLVLGNWMMESLLVWRCRVVCSTGERFLWLGTLIPCIFLLAVLVTGSLFIHNILHSAPSTLYTIAYSVSSLLLNLSATGIIAGRLLMHRHRMVRNLGPAHGGQYASIAAVIVESAALYTFFLVLVIIFFAVGSPASNILQQVVAQAQGISSLLIIFRIAEGKGWTEEARNQSSGVNSSFHASSGATQVDSDVILLDIRAGRIRDEPFLHNKNGSVDRLDRFERSRATPIPQDDVV